MEKTMPCASWRMRADLVDAPRLVRGGDLVAARAPPEPCSRASRRRYSARAGKRTASRGQARGKGASGGDEGVADRARVHRGRWDRRRRGSASRDVRAGSSSPTCSPSRGVPFRAEELAEALWGDAPPATWEKALSLLVSKLRSLLDDCGLDGSAALTSAFGCYQLTLPSGTWIDVVAADEAVSAAELALAAGDVERARTEASTAESLARHTFLPGEDARWVEEKRSELRETLVRALECLAVTQRASGDTRAAVRAAEELVELEPYRERGYRLLMEAQSAAGNRRGSAPYV